MRKRSDPQTPVPTTPKPEDLKTDEVQDEPVTPDLPEEVDTTQKPEELEENAPSTSGCEEGQGIIPRRFNWMEIFRSMMNTVQEILDIIKPSNGSQSDEQEPPKNVDSNMPAASESDEE